MPNRQLRQNCRACSQSSNIRNGSILTGALPIANAVTQHFNPIQGVHSGIDRAHTLGLLYSPHFLPIKNCS